MAPEGAGKSPEPREALAGSIAQVESDPVAWFGLRLVGKPAPGISLPGTAGKPRTLAEFRGGPMLLDS